MGDINFVCRLDWVVGCQTFKQTLFQVYPVRVLLENVNIRIGPLSKTNDLS